MAVVQKHKLSENKFYVFEILLHLISSEKELEMKLKTFFEEDDKLSNLLILIADLKR